MIYLVDTSVWIDYINGIQAEHVAFLDHLLSNPLAIGLNSQIYMEILQGTKNKKTFEKFTDYFSSQKFYYFQHEKTSYETAALIYFNCRRQGITIRSSLDCLIAQCAIENKLTLLHNDNDFKQMAGVITELEHKCFI